MSWRISSGLHPAAVIGCFESKIHKDLPSQACCGRQPFSARKVSLRENEPEGKEVGGRFTWIHPQRPASSRWPTGMVMGTSLEPALSKSVRLVSASKVLDGPNRVSVRRDSLPLNERPIQARGAAYG